MSGGAILITGGAGFIGSHLAERLLADGRRVVVYDNFDTFYDPEVKRRNIAAAEGHASYRLVQGDIRDADALDVLFTSEALTGVVHLAARAGVRPSIADPALYSAVNLDGTTQVLEACRRHGVKNFVFGSSSSVYGNNEKVPFAEDDPVDHPISPYAATKKAGEVICHAYHHLFDMKIACLRFFTVFGPRQRPEMAIHKFARLMLDGGEIEQYGDGASARDYTYISDIIDGVARAMDGLSGYHIWNLGGSRTITLATLVQKIADGLGVEPRIKRLPQQPGDVDRTWADIDAARRDLGWEPRVPFDEGLHRFLQWLKAGGEQPLPSGRTS